MVPATGLLFATTRRRRVSDRQHSPALERSPEKAGVGGSIPSLATTYFQRLSADSVPPECLSGVHLESKLGFHSKTDYRLLAPLAPLSCFTLRIGDPRGQQKRWRGKDLGY
jgi:hypothetical protein